jgi:hypothetical protein
VEKKAIHFFSPIDGSNILPSINTLGNLSLSDYDIVGGTVTNSNKLFLTMLPHKWNTETKAYLIVTEIKRSKLLVDIIYDTSGYQLSAPTLDKDIIYLIQSENELVVIDCRQNYHRDTKFLPQFDDLDKDCVSLVLADGYLCLALCDGKILALNSETGEFAKTLFENSDQHYLSKLVTDGWWLYFGISKKSLSHFYALDVRSGQIIWDYQSPKIMGERSLLLRKTILITLDNVLIALNADTGEEQWQYEMADRIKCGPRWTGESIVIIDRRGNMHALRFGASPKFFVTYHYNLKTPPTLNKWNPVIFTLVNKSHLTATQVIFRLRTDEFKGTSEHHTQELFTIGPGESRCCTVKFKPETSGSTVYVPITIGFQDEDGLTNQQNLELFMPIREFSNESMFSGVQESIKFDELQYNFIALRALLMAALSESDFATMCNNHFPAICAAFERNMSHMEKIELLLNYIQKQQQIKHLLVLIQNQNKICYEQYIQDILYFSIPLT